MTDVLDTAGQWCLDRLLTLLAERPEPEAYDLASLRPVVEAWFSEPAPGVAVKPDELALEVARQTGTDADNYPIDPPHGLDEAAEWFTVGFLRHPASATVGLDLWWPPSERLHALRSDPKWEWDTGNLIGFDCLGEPGKNARVLLEAPIVAAIFAAFGDTPPAAAVLIAHRLGGDVRLL